MTQALLVLVTLFAAVPAFIFPILYGFRSNWRHNYVGWMQMNLSVTIAIVMFFVLYLIAFPHPSYVIPVRFTEFILIGCALWWQLWVLRRARKEQKSFPSRRATDTKEKRNGRSSNNSAERVCLPIRR